MPRVEDIEKFISSLNEVGNEQGILSERGEQIEPVPLPEEGLSADLAALFEGIPVEEPTETVDVSPMSEEDATTAEFALPTNGELLDDAFFETPEEEEEAKGLEPPLDGILEAEDQEAVDSGFQEEFDSGFPFEDGKEELPSFDLPVEESAVTESPAQESSEIEEISVDDLGGEEFSLGDFGAEFGLLETEKQKEEEEPTINIPAGAAEVIAAVSEEKQFSLSNQEFEKLKQVVSSLPLNLRKAVEEVIGGNKAADVDQIKIIRYLLTGERLSTTAAFVGKLLGKSIQIPRGYEKRTGLAYEAEKETLAYIFREQVLPILRLVVLSALAVSILFYGAYLYIYRPLYARSLFQQGYSLIEANRFREGNDYFRRAFEIWADREWYFKYADLFVEKNQYNLAVAKYEELIGKYADYIHPRTRIITERHKDSYFFRAVLAYGNLESAVLRNFEKAETILQTLLEEDVHHWDGLLSLGDNYMRWAEEDPTKYTDARRTFGTLLQRYGDRDTILFRFLELFIRTDNLREVIRLKEHFQRNARLEIDVYRFALLGGYLIDKRKIEDVHSILMRALEVDPAVPEVHYQLARFFNVMGKTRDEMLALDNTLALYTQKESLTRRGLWNLIDTYRRQGDLHLRQRQVLEAERYFREGIQRYEQAVADRLLTRHPDLDRMYIGLGDLYFYEGKKFQEALTQYVKAGDYFARDPEVSYRRGYIHYLFGNFEAAIFEFLKTDTAYPAERNVLYALGNALYLRNNYSAAAGYFQFLIENLHADREKVRFFEPHDKPEDRILILHLMKAYNNLGVTLQKLSERTRRLDLSTEALALLTESIKLFENYSRDIDTMLRGDSKNLAYLNMRKIMNPNLPFELQIYRPIPIDLRIQEF